MRWRSVSTRRRLHGAAGLAAVLGTALMTWGCSSSQPPQHVSAAAGSHPVSTVQGSPGARAAIRVLVENFGQHLQDVSTLAPPAAVRGELPRAYRDMLTPALLAEWQANTDRVVGRNHGSSPWPARIVIDRIHCAQPATCRVTGTVDYVTSNEVEHGGVFMRRPIALEVARTPAGWRIASAQLTRDATAQGAK